MVPDALKDIRLHAVQPDEKFKLGNGSADIDDLPPREEVEAATAELLTRLQELQSVFYADKRKALLLVLQGRDAAGKDGVIRAVYGAFNPVGVRVAAFGPPTELELGHDFLWRIHNRIPQRGMIGVFNRSHYEDVLVVRVRKLAPESVWRPRYEQINAFEKMLTDNNVIIRKCMLHISEKEQHKRLTERLENPKKNWKFRLGDLEDRALWDDYTDAYRDALTECSTPWAPWYVVPSDDKYVRNFLIARMLVETLESCDLQYPPMAPDVREAARGFR
jgi:PPK2 family polyphosphate:nucleotide phosphotransferase